MASAEDWKPVVLRKSKINSQRTSGCNIKKTYLSSNSSSSNSEINTIRKSTGNKPTNLLSKNQFNKLDSNEEVTKPLLFSKTLGSKIAAARNQKGLDRKKLAMALSITEGDIGTIETGRMVFNQNLLNKINKQLGTHFTKSD